MLTDLKRQYPHFFSSRNANRFFKLSSRFGYEGSDEKVSYYNGKAFRNLLFKDFMVGYPVYYFSRTKMTGSSIHLRKKKSKKLW